MKTKTTQSDQERKRKRRGQSLVELAISLPLFVVMIAGLVEVGTLLVQRQRVTTAVDIAARFGSRGGSDTGISTTAYNVLTQTMPIDDLELWDIFIVRGQVNISGTGWVNNNLLTVNPIYGGQQTQTYADLITATGRITLSSDVLDGLQTRVDVDNRQIFRADENTGLGQRQSAGEDIVGVIMSYKAESVLGIDGYFDEGYELTVQKYIRISSVGGQEAGCDVYPIAVSAAVRNISARKDTTSLSAPGFNYYEKTSTDYDPFDNSVGNLNRYIFPPANDEDARRNLQWDEFTIREGGRSVLPVPSAADPNPIGPYEGDIYVMYRGVDFEWLFFGDAPDTTTVDDMDWPGNSQVYNAYNGTLGADLNPGIHRGDLIKHAAVGGRNEDRGVDAIDSLQDHITAGRSMRVPVVPVGADGTTLGTTQDFYEIQGFLIMKILGYGNAGPTDPKHPNRDFIVAEAVRFDTSCGQN